MLLLIICIGCLTYYKGFTILNYFRDYFLLGLNRNNYIEQELKFIHLNQRIDKDLEKAKHNIIKKYNQQLSDQDSKIGSRILRLRLENVYKKYGIINDSNTDLIGKCHTYLKELIINDYNACIATIIKIMQIKKKSSNK